LRTLPFAAAACLVLHWGASVLAIEHVTFQREGVERKISGQLVVEAADGGVLLRAPDGRLWAIEPQDLVARSSDESPFEALPRDALAKQLSEELPGFRIHHTEHYLICYNTSRAYAEWCGALYERLFKAFYSYWQDRGLTLAPPETPLVALVFQDKATYREYAQAELGAAVEAIDGYYSLPTNRVMMYDLTGVEGAGLGDRVGLSARVNAILSRPGAEGTVATIIHEATHQLAFNSGMHQRLGAIPRWLSEGMAIYFETPDLKNARGWTRIGAVNQLRLLTFRQSLPSRPVDSLAQLISSDARFLDPRTAKAAYAEAWALNYFLIRNHQKAYTKYLETLAEKGPLLPDSPEERLQDFAEAFGEDIAKLDAAFLKYMQRVRP
jgi:hypothetical protein